MEDQGKLNFRQTLSALLRSNRRHVRYIQALACLALIVAVAVPLSMRQSGVAMSTTETRLSCHYAGSGAHTHNADCYDDEGNLVCPLEEKAFHTHTDECYATERVLVCGQEETAGHTHSASCYDAEGNLTCTLTEEPAHKHTDACYEERITDELVCGLEETVEEHVHGPACFETVTVQVADAEGADEDSPVNTTATVEGTPEEDPTPAQEFTGTLKQKDENGNEYVTLVAQVKAPQGALPKGSTMRVEAVDLQARDVQDVPDGPTVQDKLDEALRTEAGDTAAFTQTDAVDITFYDAQGNRIDPAGKVEVRITTSMIRTFSDQRTANDEAVANNSLLVLHVVDKQHTTRTDAPDAEVMRDVYLINQDEHDTTTGHENTIVFEATEFSAYVVARVDNAHVAPEAEPVVADTAELAEAEAKADDEATAEADAAADKAEAADDADPAEAKDAPKATEPTYPAQTFTHRFTGKGGKALLRVDVAAPEGAFPADTTMKVAWVDTVEVEDAVTEAVAERTDGKLLGLCAVDITFYDPEGNEIEPAKKITVTFGSDFIDTEDDSYVVHIDDKGKGEVVDALGAKDLEKREIADQADELVFESDAFSTYVVAVTTLRKELTAGDGKTYEVAVDASAEAGIPQDAELRVSEIVEGDEGYEEYLKQTVAALGSKPDENKVQQARFFDIKIMQGEEEIHPQAPVKVSVNLADASKYADVATFDAVHFADEAKSNKPDVLDSSQEAGVVSFETDGFSVFGVVYTVDFHWEVDGKTYGFSMQGADSVSLRALIEALHVYERPVKTDADSSDNSPQVEAEVSNEDLVESEDGHNAKLDTFMDDIKTVTFSNAELLVPVKVEKNTTVGQIKDDLKLYPTYPLGLSQAEVLALNAKEYEAGDWALISMKAFDTEETLTVTMKNGDVFEIKVTDAQDAIMVGGVVQTITNPAGTTIDLFDYWITDELKDTAGRNAWPGGHNSNGWTNDWKYQDIGLQVEGQGTEAGINQGHAFKFSPAWAGTVRDGTTNYSNQDASGRINSYTGQAPEYWCVNPNPGIVQNNLYNGYPILTNNSNKGTNGESLAYLFDPSIGHAGKASYDGADQLLYVDKDGYYTYDSRDYAAAFDTDSKTFTLTEQTSSNSEIRGFWPFGTQVFWTGMHVNTQFSMPTGGQVLNPSGELKPMQFEFSGDDDVWIYVDGILVGDAGGIHNRTEVDINFQTGIVTISGSQDKYLDDLFRTGLRDQGKTDSEIEAYIADNFDDHTFKSGTYHTFDFFYLERGGGESNLYIHYNLVSTADFTAHKSYYGADEADLLTRDQFRFELIGLDGKYRSVENAQTGEYVLELDDPLADAIMPKSTGSGEGTVASPDYQDNVTMTISTGAVNSQVYTTGVTEDGNVNFGTAEVSEADMHDADVGNPPVYKYIIREVVPEDAVNGNGVTWAEATPEQKAAGGFVKDQIVYDGTVYYMTGRVISWTETNASGQGVVRHGLSKTYYTDDTYTTVRSDVSFANFENRFTPDFGNVDFKKVDVAGNPLQGAVFALYTDEACTIPATDLDTEGHAAWTAASDSNGTVSFENVRIGTYYMKETVAPTDYELDGTVYKVVIEDSKDTTKSSKIVVNGDATGTPVTKIINTKPGEISVIKKWVDPNGNEVAGGSRSATVQLRRYKTQSTIPQAYTVSFTMQLDTNGDWIDGIQYWTPIYVTSSSTVGGNVDIEWYDCWQEYYSIEVKDSVGNAVPYYTWSIDENNHSRLLRIPNISCDCYITVKYGNQCIWLRQDNGHWQKAQNVSIVEAGGTSTEVVIDESFPSASDTAATQALSSTNNWAYTWNIGDGSGYDFPATDGTNPYYYYLVELKDNGDGTYSEVPINGEVQEGVTLKEINYSPLKTEDAGIQAGSITVVNEVATPDTIDIVIKKTDDAEESTNYLSGAVFKLLYRQDATGSYVGVSQESVEQLDSDSQFTVPAEGITLTGLIDGQYQLQEILPPAGYIITNSAPVTFTVSGGVIISTDGTISEVTYTSATETSDAEFTIPNPPGAELPAAGGSGTILYTLCGIAMIAVAGYIGFVSRRNARKEDA